MEVQYGSEPKRNLRYATRELATETCLNLNKFRLQIGAHSCAFTADKLPEGDFGIICICHPVKSGNKRSRKDSPTVKARLWLDQH